ncbi:Polysaccharide pyruvyl transferase family protein WcaK [Sphingomonas sp. OV641]|uniref:polysaccharide pyruvyl transferase family protein n=1 Tax=Sphingomonas sp. OV641 TaxID=1881068 RepID=UPI0008AD75AA|nr:polysaccharide pyruvyl transferase family protein [Sphingomonas sp. OV641]SEJ21468.1 Polysaccharide pyruvyl transferase family protein WcaK [Sphingomonas sp. OV641]
MTIPIHVALPWHAIGHGNLGVDALTRSNIAILRGAAARIGREVRFTTLCAVNRVDPTTIDPDVTIGPMPSPKAIATGRSDFLKVLRTADVVVDIGEGDSWTDIYGGKRFAFHAGTKMAALALGKPLVLAPQTMGPFDTPWRRRVATAIMNRARAVYARDSLSSDFLRGCKLTTETGEFIDVAFRLPFDRRPRDGVKRRLGMNVSGLLYRGGYRRANEFGLTIDYPALTHRLIEHWSAKPDTEVHLIPHVVAFDGNDDDRTVIPELTSRYPQLVVPPDFASASAAKGYMSGLDFVVGGRMHACIGAFSAQVPVVPIAYSRKFNGLFGTLGYPHYVDGRALDTDAAFATVVQGYEDRAALAAAIEPGLSMARERLDQYEARLAAILQEVASHG